MMAYAQLEVLGFLPTLQLPKMLQPPEVDLGELKRRIYDPEVGGWGGVGGVGGGSVVLVWV